MEKDVDLHFVCVFFFSLFAIPEDMVTMEYIF